MAAATPEGPEPTTITSKIMSMFVRIRSGNREALPIPAAFLINFSKASKL